MRQFYNILRVLFAARQHFWKRLKFLPSFAERLIPGRKFIHAHLPGCHRHWCWICDGEKKVYVNFTVWVAADVNEANVILSIKFKTRFMLVLFMSSTARWCRLWASTLFNLWSSATYGEFSFDAARHRHRHHCAFPMTWKIKEETYSSGAHSPFMTC